MHTVDYENVKGQQINTSKRADTLNGNGKASGSDDEMFKGDGGGGRLRVTRRL